MTRRQPCAGGIVFDAERRILLIKRGQPPSEGMWSVPGGRCLPGEPAEQACVRELREETGLAVSIARFAGQVEGAAPNGGIYVIDDYVCQIVGGALQAGDDADDARWVSRLDLGALVLVPGLYESLSEWGLLPD